MRGVTGMRLAAEPGTQASPSPVEWAELLERLPPVRRTPAAREAVLRSMRERNTRLLVVDDDPTGSQAVRDVAVLTRWDEASLDKVGAEEMMVSFVLTNS